MSIERLVLVALLFVLGGTIVPACQDSADNATDADASAQPTNRYVVRGMVTQTPAPANPRSEFLVRHEPIPAFKANYNETTPTGMNAMIMPFPLADGVDISGLQVGDKITLEFVVFYEADTGDIASYRTTTITPLEPDTELNFGRAAPDEAVEIDAMNPSDANPAIQDTPSAQPNTPESPGGTTGG
jgi:hypothetical protein